MPNWCYNEVEIEGDKKTILELLEFMKSDKSNFDFDKIIPYPENFRKMDEEDLEIHSKGFNSGGYEWCVENWGTKWYITDASITSTPEGVVIGFDTAWSPPSPVIYALSAKFPTLYFKLSYEEGGCDFSGYEEMQGGEVVGGGDGTFDQFPLSDHN